MVIEKVERNVPEFRFPEFEENWAEKETVELFSNSRKKGNDSLAIYSVTQNRGLIPRNSLNRKLGGDADKNLYVGLKYLTYNMMRMWQGAIGLAEQECMVSPAYIVLKPAQDTCSEFFINFFQRGRSLYLFWAHSYGLTNDRLRLYYKDFSQIVFLTPTLSEQQKIASFLSVVDKKIEQLTLKKALLEQYKKGVMQKIFSQENRFKDENGQDYPEWEKKKIHDIVVKNKGAMKIGPFGSQLRKDTFVIEGYKVYGQENVFVKDFTFGDRYISNEHFRKLKSNELQPGDYVISTMGTIGKSCIVPNGIQKGIMDSHLIRLRLNPKTIYPLFLSQLFLTYDFQKQIKRCSVGGIMAGLSMGIIKELKFFIPSILEQQYTANFLSSIDDKIDSVQTQLTQTQNFKKGLLQKMFV